jgi:chorismate mutase/prephenate dehydratase
MFNQGMLSQLGKFNVGVIIERNNMASIEDWLTAAHKVLDQGNQQVILCESGIRSFAQPECVSLDLAGLITVKQTCHLPIICNISANATEIEYSQVSAAKQLNANGVVLSATANDANSLLLRKIYQD